MGAIDIGGVSVGHAQDLDAATGCTVVLCPGGAVGAVDVRGGSPATRETDLLDPSCTVVNVNAVVLSGGSAFGLDACSGVMRYLEELGVGYPTGVKNVPIVCGAALFDLGIGDPNVRPDARMGYAACEAAVPLSQAAVGSVGAGTGASVGKTAGEARMTKSGLGIGCEQVGDLVVVAISAVNALGTVTGADGAPIAGVRSEDGSRFLSPREAVAGFVAALEAAGGNAVADGSEEGFPSAVSNTTISCVVTNGRFDKAQIRKVAAMAHDGYARAIDPVHTTLDGDLIFAIATGEVDSPVDVAGTAAAWAMAEAIRDAAMQATDLCGVKSASSH